MKEIDSSVKHWLKLAEGDYFCAKHLLSLYPLRLEVICYLCEQAVEKYLKGFLLLHKKEPPRTHDLVALNRLCSEIDNSFSSIFPACARLVPYGVHVRYPSNIEILEEDMRLALHDTEQVLQHIFPILESYSYSKPTL